VAKREWSVRLAGFSLTLLSMCSTVYPVCSLSVASGQTGRVSVGATKLFSLPARLFNGLFSLLALREVPRLFFKRSVSLSLFHSLTHRSFTSSREVFLL